MVDFVNLIISRYRYISIGKISKDIVIEMCNLYIAIVIAW
nr:MAG TPA: hypothetical protein [Caudoviricetes sp.]DAG32343.1 MAG TPA: hypothetical protein [Caudoviricetes sp.]